MKTGRSQNTKLTKQFGLFSLSTIIVLFLVAVLLAPITMVQAANPTSNSLSPATGASVTWNGTAPGGASPDGEATCVEGTNCDTFTLTVAEGDWSGKFIKVNIAWNLPASDYDFYIHKGSVTGPETNRSGEAPPVISETAEIDPSTTGTGTYAIRVVYYAATGLVDQYRGTATVETKSAGGVEPTPPPVSSATAPTYDNFAPPSTLGQRAGEPTIGLNWATGKAMFIAGLQTLRVTFNETVSGVTASWENKSAPNTSVQSFDPILFTDSSTNRTFVSQLVPGVNKIANPLSFTDDDGNNWTPSQGSGINSGVDHQTVGGGPYAKNADGSLKGGAVQRPGLDAKFYPNAVYYASQDIGLAEIARSDDGGLTFGVAVPMYDLTQCNGLHGHIKVAPDGTVYVPNKNCGGEQAVAVSEDNGMTWDIRKIPGSKAGRNDGSVGISTDGTIYVGYTNGDGTPRIAVSRDKGRTFENDTNVGFYQGIKNTVFPAVTAGDPDRAAFFFLGTTTAGSAATGTDQTSPYVDAVWYGFISTTYDGGKTWVTVNATPNDPVQRGVVCTNGTTCPSGTRNLLDFNDMEVDKQGRAVAALADGCITDACIQGVDKNGDGQFNTRFDNDGARRALIIRQSSGLGLFSAFDPVTTVTETQIEDDDSRVAYSNGWHLIKDSKASAGHFRLNNGSDSTHFARLSFDVKGQSGSITYNFAKSTKGGSAEVFIDGVSKGIVDFRGSQGSMRAPEYGHSLTFDKLSSGSHTLELRNIKGSVYVDGFTLKSASTSSSPTSGPGKTSSSTNTVSLGGELLQNVNVEDGATALSVIAESSAPIRLVVVDPSGSILGISDASNGTASVEMPVSQGGTYLVKVVNLSAGPVQVFTASTALVSR
jgi:hypothetical protein